MKNLLIVLSVIVCLCIACSRHRRLPTGWESSGNPLADTLTLRLERSYGHNAGAPSQRWVWSLDSIALADKENGRVGARAAYWRVRLNLRMGKVDRARHILDSAMSALDSTRYTDDFHHLKMLRWRFDRSLLHRYLDAIDNLKYFRGVGDSTSVAYVLMDLGDIMERIGDFGRGRAFCLEASRIWRNIGQNEYADKNLLNVALMSDRNQTDSIHRLLLANKAYHADTAFYELVLRNHFLNTDSVEYLLRAFPLSGGTRRMRGMRAVHLALFSDWLSRNGRGREALPSALEAQKLHDSTGDPEFNMLVSHALAMAYHAANTTDSAEKYLLEYVRWKDSISDSRMAMEVANKASRDEINNVDMARNVKAERERLMVWIFLLAVVLVFFAVSFSFYRRARDREMKAAIARTELEHTKSRLGREAIIMYEKEQLLKSIQQEIEHGESEGQLNASTSARLRNAIKVHNSGEEERRAFLEVHDNMLPGFSARLKGTYSSLSEKQIRLAAYICAGMSSAAIGRVLNITPASVVKNRYRLRSKLGLAPGESLEDFLRKFAE